MNYVKTRKTNRRFHKRRDLCEPQVTEPETYFGFVLGEDTGVNFLEALIILKQ